MRVTTFARILFVLFLVCPAARAQSPARAPQPAQAGKAVTAGKPAAAASLPAGWPSEAVRGAHAMVVSDDGLASAAGVEILKKGGNAVDAAVAVAFALAVVEPEAGNIGGGGFMLIRLADGGSAFVDYREVAPKKATRNMYLGANGTLDPEAAVNGIRAVAVPGTVAGLALALEGFGRMNLSKVMAPAIRLAKHGFPVSERLARRLREGRAKLEQFSLSRRIFLRDGALYQPGEIFRQPELAATLHRIARHGAREFYHGGTARNLVGEMEKMGGLITRDDLEQYRPRLRRPLQGVYVFGGHRWDVMTSPPPSSGGVAILEALNILAPIPLDPAGWSDPRDIHWVAEALRRVFADRAAYLADSDFTPVPVRGLTDPRYAAELRSTIDPVRASPSGLVHAGNPKPFDPGWAKPAGESETMLEWLRERAERSGHTTHFSVVDAAGNAVSNTYTINDFFGSGVTAPGGFLLNDEMDDFTTAPGEPNRLYGLVQSEANAIAPGKRPLSSMTPTILLRDGRLSFVTGSPGGPRIISATLLSAINWMRLGMGAQQAVNAPRFHEQWMPDVLYVEPILPAAAIAALTRTGYTVEVRRPSPWIGQVEAIGIDPQTGARMGAPDPRQGGAAAGY
jgi:gamma-glutamyltranspeptidase / glutathione hydrolase